MNVKCAAIVVVFSAVVFALPDSTFGAPDDAGSPKPYVMNGTHHLTIHSSIIGEDYDLYVCFPNHYQDTSRRFPVLYLVDGQYDFPLVHGSYYDQYYDGRVPDLIIVGITWGAGQRSVDSLRMRDYTPTADALAPQSGNGPKFLAFIKKELIPYVEAHYRTDSHDRTLMGSSLGGLFALYALFHETDVFNRYIITSPALQWGNFVVNTFEEAYHSKHSDLPVRLFMSIGELEGIDGMFQSFVDRLKSRGYKGLQLHTMVLAEMGHAGGKPEGFTRGMQSVFERSVKSVAPAALEPLLGRYYVSGMSDNPQASVSVVKENERLLLLVPGGTKLPLLAETEDDFFVRGIYLFLKFLRGSSGEVTGVHVEQFPGAYDLVKAKNR